MSGFASHIVMPDQVNTVFPLVREAVPGLDLATWVDFARKQTNPRRAAQAGIVAVRRIPRPMPCGLFLYRTEHDLAYGPTLATEYVVALDVLDPAPVVSALTVEMEALARRLGCRAIRATLREHSAAIEAGLRDAGLIAEGATLWKLLAPAPADD